MNVTERHAAMRSVVGKTHIMRYLLTAEEINDITYASQFIKYLKEKIEIYGDPVIKDLIFKNGEIIITGHIP